MNIIFLYKMISLIKYRFSICFISCKKNYLNLLFFFMQWGQEDDAPTSYQTQKLMSLPVDCSNKLAQ